MILLTTRLSRQRAISITSALMVAAFALLHSVPKAIAHGGDGHIDLPPVNQLTGTVDSSRSTWFLGLSTISRMGLVGDESISAVDEHEEEDAPGEEVGHHDHAKNANNFLFSPSIGYQLNRNWAFLASGSLDFAEMVRPVSPTSSGVVFGDPSLSAIRSDTLRSGAILINSFSLLAPFSKESKEVSRAAGLGYSALGVFFLSSKWDFLPSLLATHYLSQRSAEPDEQPQTQFIASAMLRYSIRKWNTALQTGVRYQEGRTGGQGGLRYLNVVPLRADINLGSFAMSLYPELRNDLREARRVETFAVVEAIYSFASIGRPVIQAASGPAEEIRHEHDETDTHVHYD